MLSSSYSCRFKTFQLPKKKRYYVGMGAHYYSLSSWVVEVEGLRSFKVTEPSSKAFTTVLISVSITAQTS